MTDLKTIQTPEEFAVAVQSLAGSQVDVMVQKADNVVGEIFAEAKNKKRVQYLPDKHLITMTRDHFFPALINKMGIKNCVEVGVDKAEFSAHLLGRSNLEFLTCVDTWMDDFGSDFKPGYYDKDGGKRLNEAKENLVEYIRQGRVEMMKMTSLEAACQFDVCSLDMVYIDGDHSLEGIYTDIKAWLPRVKMGGILAGHDYKDGENSGILDHSGNQLWYRVKTVVDEYCQRYGYSLRIAGGVIKNWWFVKDRKTRDDVKAYLLTAPEAM